MAVPRHPRRGFPLGGVPLEGHCCCLYEDAQQRIAILTELFRTALVRRERCIYTARGHIDRALKNSLRAAGIDVEAAIESGALELRRAEAVYGPFGELDPAKAANAWRQAARQAVREGFTGLSVASETPRGAPGGRHAGQWLAYERALTRTVSEIGGTFVCVYSRRATSLQASLEVLRAHPAGLASGIIGRSVYYERAERTRTSSPRSRRERSGKGRIAPPPKDAGWLGAPGMARMSRVFTLGVLTASIAHEVRQPLAAVAANANAGIRWLKSRRPQLDLARKSLARILRDANRAADIIARIRSLATRGTTTGKRPLHINKIVRHVVASIEGDVSRADTVLRVELAADIPSVIGDGVQLQQVVLNLLTNAVEAMKDVRGRPKEVAILTHCGADGQVTVTVRDSGRAGGSEGLARAFEPFYTNKPHGMGIGLSICRAIVEEHDGRLWATRNARHGASFHFSLPRRRGAHR